MELIYRYTGIVVVWLLIIGAGYFVVRFLVAEIFNELGRRFKMMWQMVEFFHYRKQFKKWVKDKQRHPKAE